MLTPYKEPDGPYVQSVVFELIRPQDESNNVVVAIVKDMSSEPLSDDSWFDQFLEPVTEEEEEREEEEEASPSSSSSTSSVPHGLAQLIESEEFRPGIDAFDRVTQVGDPWILKMQALDGKFEEFKVEQKYLELLKRSVVLGNPPPSNSYLTDIKVDLKIDSLNPLAASLAFYLYSNSQDKKSTKRAISRIEVAISDRDCHNPHECPSMYGRCVAGKCRLSSVDLASVLRYHKMWQRCYTR